MPSIFLALCIAALAVGGAAAGAPAKGSKPLTLQQALSRHQKTLKCLAPGRKALARRDFAKAREVFKACARQHPENLLPLHLLGMAQYVAGERQKALATFKDLVRRAPRNPHALAMLGKLYSFDRRKLNLAQELLGRALALRPALREARFDLARVHALKGDFQRSLAEFAVLLRGERRFALYRTELGKVLMAMGRKKAARAQFKRALVLLPGFPPARRYLKALAPKGKGKGSKAGQKGR